MQRAPKIRLLSLAGTAALAVAVPLAVASAGPANTAERADGALAGRVAAPGAPVGEARGGAATGKLGARRARAVGIGKAENGGRTRDPLAVLGLPLLSGDGRRTSHCGPELASARRIEAQTCVLAEKGLTWARTYYRNPTGDPLRAVLTLLRPDGRSVQVHCEVPAADEPGVCETPTGATVHEARAAYAAVAEFSDAAEERLLLRSGGNSAPDGGGSGARRAD
ncbi:hypothetical protein [Streptomyces sp. NPDC048638]|uniref:hypothetical protein n=1 Tax=Streptomyces sp. NPDC048638 TaxID=3365580 RepID=UPI00371FF9FB